MTEETSASCGRPIDSHYPKSELLLTLWRVALGQHNPMPECDAQDTRLIQDATFFNLIHSANHNRQFKQAENTQIMSHGCAQFAVRSPRVAATSHYRPKAH